MAALVRWVVRFAFARACDDVLLQPATQELNDFARVRTKFMRPLGDRRRFHPLARMDEPARPGSRSAGLRARKGGAHPHLNARSPPAFCRGPRCRRLDEVHAGGDGAGVDDRRPTPFPRSSDRPRLPRDHLAHHDRPRYIGKTDVSGHPVRNPGFLHTNDHALVRRIRIQRDDAHGRTEIRRFTEMDAVPEIVDCGIRNGAAGEERKQDRACRADVERVTNIADRTA